MEIMSDTLPAGVTDLPAHRLRRAQEPPRAAIIGGGPLGLEAALYASSLGHQVWLFEREAEIAPDVHAWAHVAMFTHWASNRSPLGERALRGTAKLPAGKIYPSGGDFISQYLEPLAKLLSGSILKNTRVVAVGRSYLFPDEHGDEPEKRTARRFRLLTRSPQEERISRRTMSLMRPASAIRRAGWARVGCLPWGRWAAAALSIMGCPMCWEKIASSFSAKGRCW